MSARTKIETRALPPKNDLMQSSTVRPTIRNLRFVRTKPTGAVVGADGDVMRRAFDSRSENGRGPREGQADGCYDCVTALAFGGTGAPESFDGNHADLFH